MHDSTPRGPLSKEEIHAMVGRTRTPIRPLLGYQIAALIGVSNARVGQLERRALRKLARHRVLRMMAGEIAL